MKSKLVVASLAWFGSFGALGLGAWATGCGSSNPDIGFNSGGHDGGDQDGSSSVPNFGPTGDGARGCVGLQCQQHACSGNPNGTTVSGKVYDPAGNNPLYNVVVYVPDGVTQIQPIVNGVQPDTACSCSSLYTGNPITTTLTDAQGNFTLANVPDGANIPLVIQVGKWRKLVTLPTVAQCQDNPQPDKSIKFQTSASDHGQSAPSYNASTVDNIPSIAVSTGDSDTMECLLKRIGLQDGEYADGATGNGHIHIFAGSGGPTMSGSTPSSTSKLWDSEADLAKYDIVILSCEGNETTTPNQQAMHDYTNAGGRVFASHYHYAWFNSGPYASDNLATWVPGTNDMFDINATIVQTLADGGVFPKGQALSQWLGTVGALGANGAPAGELPISNAKYNTNVLPSNTPSQPWILGDSKVSLAGPEDVQPDPNGQYPTEYFSFNTPLNPPTDPKGEPLYCGRVVYSDLHVGAASGDDTNSSGIPAGCTNNKLSPQEDALEFMLFDLSSCVTPDGQKPQPPPVR